MVQDIAGDQPGAYRAMYILGLAGAFSPEFQEIRQTYRPLLETFLDDGSDPMMARLALQIMCDDWGYAADCREFLLRFIHGVVWDAEDDVRQIAILLTGRYLRSHRDPELLAVLIRIFEDQRGDDLVRQDAYLALADAVGRSWKELPSAAREFNVDTDTDPRVLVEAKQRLERAESFD
ncbi:MAG TPA: hypothetical protein VFI42_08800 [Thermomicrobiaceae bacterium]|nr:hypothetical protein [Thermomicrobiaceae bacterium]